MPDQEVCITYSKLRALYSILVPAIAGSAILALTMSHYESVAQRVHEKPFAVPLIIAGFAIWIGGCWPNAFKIISDGLERVRFFDGRVFLTRNGNEEDLGTITSIQGRPSLFLYGRFRITTDQLADPYDIITSFARESDDVSPAALASALAKQQTR